MSECDCPACTKKREEEDPVRKEAFALLNRALRLHGLSSPEEMGRKLVELFQKSSEEAVNPISESINEELKKLPEGDPVRSTAVSLFEATTAYYFLQPFLQYMSMLNKSPGDVARMAVNAAIELEARERSRGFMEMVSKAIIPDIEKKMREDVEERVKEVNGPDN